MTDHEEAVEMLAIAERDFRGLSGMLDAEVFADELFGFMAQQVLEKTLKAWLCEIGEEYPRTHSIARLLALLRERQQGVDNIEDLDEFTPFAGELRYSRSALGSVVEDRADVVRRVRAVVEQVRQIITQGNAI